MNSQYSGTKAVVHDFPSRTYKGDLMSGLLETVNAAEKAALPRTKLVDSLILAMNALTATADRKTGMMSRAAVNAWLDLAALMGALNEEN